MEWVRVMQNPYGDNVLIGLAWDVMWLVIVGGVLFMLGHAYFARGSTKPHASAAVVASSGLPERITRHGKSARYSHWTLAVATLTLVVTAFVPMLGLLFPWVTVHWLAGLILAGYIVYHVVDTLARKSWGAGSMLWIGPKEIGESVSRTREFFQRDEGDPAKRPGKWGVENKLFHHAIMVAGFGVVLTGIFMMLRIKTWFWEANPYFNNLADSTVGLIFLIHGICAASFVGLLIAHIYFALRPETLWFTRSMFKGWITREEYLGHFNPSRWRVASQNGTKPVGPGERVPAGVGSGSDSLTGTRK
jgi:cytochrome b subunit of formate dehydrogenase